MIKNIFSALVMLFMINITLAYDLTVQLTDPIFDCESNSVIYEIQAKVTSFNDDEYDAISTIPMDVTINTISSSLNFSYSNAEILESDGVTQASNFIATPNFNNGYQYGFDITGTTGTLNLYGTVSHQFVSIATWETIGYVYQETASDLTSTFCPSILFNENPENNGEGFTSPISVEASVGGYSATIIPIHVNWQQAGDGMTIAYGQVANSSSCLETGCCLDALEISSSNFESNMGDWIDGGVNNQRFNNAALASSGTWSARIRNGDASSLMVSKSFALNNFESVSIAFDYITTGMNNDQEGFKLQLSTDGGSTYSTVQNWFEDIDFQNNVSESETVVVLGPFSSDTRFRFMGIGNSNSDRVYLDDIKINTCNTVTNPPTCNDGIYNGFETSVDCGGPDCDACPELWCDGEQYYFDDFDSGWGNWIDGGSDARRHINDANYANSGSYCARLRDNSVSSFITTGSLDLSAYNQARISFTYIARSVAFVSDDLWFQVSLDGGPFTTVKAWNLGTDFDDLVREFEDFFLEIPFTSDTKFRFRFDALSNGDLVYLDDIYMEFCSFDAPTCYEEKHDPCDPNINLLEHLSNESAVKTSHFNHYNNGASTPLLFDEATSSSGNDGCFLLTDAKGAGTDGHDQIELKLSEAIPVNPNTTYTFSFKMKTPSLCPSPGVQVFQRFYKADGTTNVSLGSNFHSSEIDTWETMSFSFVTPDDAVKFKFSMTNFFEYEGVTCDDCGCDAGNDDCWPIYLDELYMVEDICFDEEPVAKEAYTDHPDKRIDAYGNIEIYENNEWKAFFPLMVYTTNYRIAPFPQYENNDYVYSSNDNDASNDGYNLYSAMGFNTAAWSSIGFTLPYVIDAGMFGNIALDNYGFDNDPVGELEEDLDLIMSNGQIDDVLFMYQDNEHMHNSNVWVELFETVRSYTTALIYQLNGHPGHAARYNNENCDYVNVNGTYIGPNRFQKLITLDNLNTNSNPASIAQYTTGDQDKDIRPVVYGSIAHGARGFGYFWDRPYVKDENDEIVYNPDGDIQNASWYEDFNNIACEVNNMLPIIRMPHWNPFDITADNDKVDFGARVYDGQLYIFVANSSETAEQVNFDLSGANLFGSAVTDYNYDTAMGSMVGMNYSLTLEAGAGMLLKFEDLLPAVTPVLTCDIPVDLTNYTVCDPIGLLNDENGGSGRMSNPMVEEQFEVEVYPNPFVDVVNITMQNLKGNVNVSVVNSNGQIVYTENNIEGTSISIPTKNWSVGTYFVQLSYDDYEINAKYPLESTTIIKAK